MHIGLPTSGQRNPKFMGDESTEHSYVARTCDLHHIRIEVSRQLHHFSITPPQGKVVFVSLVERERQWTPLKLEPSYRTRSHNLVAETCMNRQEWELAVLRKCFKMSAGVRDAVHFIVSIREESDSQTPSISISHDIASYTPSDGNSKLIWSLRICAK